MPRHEPKEQRRAESKRLLDVRALMGLSQQQFANELKVTPAAVAQWESGKRTLPGPMLRLLELYERELNLAQPSTGADDELGLEQWRATRLMTGTMSMLMAGAFRRFTRDASEDSFGAHVRALVANHLGRLLGRSKGLLMKFSQQSAFFDRGAAGAPLSLASHVRAEIQPMSTRQAQTMVLEALGQTPAKAFDAWDESPLATASLGQVHRAAVGGRPVAVKVQYPKIVNAVLADIANLALFEKLHASIFRGQRRRVLSETLRQVTLKECDYVLEAESQSRVRQIFRGDEAIQVPQVVESHSRRTVLTTELATGTVLSQLKPSTAQVTRNQIGALVWRFAHQLLLEHRLVYSDIHAGNFLWNGRQLTVVDFGQLEALPEAFFGPWLSMVRGVLESDAHRFDRACVDIGWVSDPKTFDFAYNRKMAQVLFAPWLVEGPFDFETEYLRRLHRAVLTENPNWSQMSLVPETVLLQQLPLGVISLLNELGAQCQARATVMPLVYGPSEKRPAPLAPEQVGLGF